MSDRVKAQCDQCGQVDDHPKVHVGTTLDDPDVQYHHDCLPFRVREQLLGHAHAKAVIEACEGGLRGADLLAHIEQIHQEG